ncbi:MAG TPA: lysylphosphatidylglycerol synthase transmembrane domain-containing protein [Acidimicrobiales bacterium]|nr:lysylphosphatidylglycerol synthase transmembrane domain-containing protein [Acidimicrobiales bacterium]
MTIEREGVAPPVAAVVAETPPAPDGVAPAMPLGEGRVRLRRWGAIFFSPPGDGARRRRGTDGLKLGAGLLAVLCAWLVYSADSKAEDSVTTFLHSAPQGIAWLVTVVFAVGAVGLIVLIVGLAFVSFFLGRREVLRDVALAGGVAWFLAWLLQQLTAGSHPSDPTLDGIKLGFPIVIVAVGMAVVTAALPYLARAVQRLVELGIAFVALATVVHGSGLPTAVLAGLALGWAVTAAVHLAFGSPLGLPSGADVALLLRELGVEASGVTPFPRQIWGVARYSGTDPLGRVDASVYGRDAADAQMLGKVFRFAFYRDSGPTLVISRVQQVEHEAYLTLLAAQAGANVSEVLAAAPAGPSKDAVLATRPPEGERLVELFTPVERDPLGEDPDEDDTIKPLAEGLGDAAVEDLFRQVLVLRSAGLTHGAVSPETVVVGDGRAGLVDFRIGTSHATADRLARDVAGALATIALAVGAERAVAAAARVLPHDALASALPHLQRAALDPITSRWLRGKKALLGDLREGGAAAAGVDLPELAEPRRVSWATFVLVLGSVIGGWALIGVLINVSKSFDTIKGADWGWVVAVFVLAQSAYPSEAVAVLGSVENPLFFSRVLALEVANTFVALAGGTPAVLATRIRYFQQEGYSPTLAVSSGVLVSTASWIVKGALFLISIPLAWSTFHFGQEPTGSSSSKQVWLILMVVIGVGLLLGLVLLVPRLRRLASHKLRPHAVEVWHHLKTLAVHPSKLVEVFGGSMVSQLAIAFSLGASLHAFGQHLSLPALIIVITLASMLGGVSPVPGGMGVVEAGMILGLTAAGISESVAVAAVFVQRLFTSYLPPIWGWFVLMWMRRKEYV